MFFQDRRRLDPLAAARHRYRAYCDNDNGGWQLALRAAATDSEFLFASSYWEDDALLNSGDFDVAADRDAKYATFVEQPVGYVRACFKGNTAAGACNMHGLPTEYVCNEGTNPAQTQCAGG